MERKSFGLFLLVLNVLAAEVAVQTEGRRYQSQSHGFRGSCWVATTTVRWFAGTKVSPEGGAEVPSPLFLH